MFDMKVHELIIGVEITNKNKLGLPTEERMSNGRQFLYNPNLTLFSFCFGWGVFFYYKQMLGKAS